MPKNVIIMEGGKGLRFADVSKLITDKSNGNDSWVPTEDRIIRQKYISENGIYYANDDGIYGFSKLTVNIPGGAQGHTVPTVSTLPYGVEVATTDPSQPMPIIPGTVGSSLIGIDPDTGLRSIATVQPDGTLSKKVIPSAIRVLIPPAKTTYRVGEKIQYAGLVVELLDSDGNNFQDDRFPEGIIPWSPVKNLLDDSKNLITSTIYAEFSEYNKRELDGATVSYSGGTSVTISINEGGGDEYHVGEKYYVTEGDGPFYRFGTKWFYGDERDDGYPDGGRGGFICSNKSFNAKYIYTNSNPKTALVRSYTRDGKTVYYSGRDAFQGYFNPIVDAPVNDERDWEDKSVMAWAIFYGTVIGGNDNVMVQWNSPYDGVTYETSFEISAST